jgi:hypothetical protein
MADGLRNDFDYLNMVLQGLKTSLDRHYPPRGGRIRQSLIPMLLEIEALRLLLGPSDRMKRLTEPEFREFVEELEAGLTRLTLNPQFEEFAAGAPLRIPVSVAPPSRIWALDFCGRISKANSRQPLRNLQELALPSLADAKDAAGPVARNVARKEVRE